MVIGIAPVKSLADDEDVRSKPASIVRHNLKTASLGEYEETVNRPLFAKTRRPPIVTSTDGKEIRPSEIDKLVLTGIVIGPDKKLAILMNGVSRNEIRLQEGHAFQGWRLDQLATDDVTFSREGETRKLPLYKEKQPASTAPSGIVGVKEALQQHRTRQQRTRKSQN